MFTFFGRMISSRGAIPIVHRLPHLSFPASCSRAIVMVSATIRWYEPLHNGPYKVLSRCNVLDELNDDRASYDEGIYRPNIIDSALYFRTFHLDGSIF